MAQDLLQEFNARCRPSWSAKEIAHKLDDAISKPFRKPDGWLLLHPNGDPAADFANESDEPWPALISLDVAEAPEISTDPLVPGLKRMVDEVARAIEVPPELPLGLALTIASAAAAHAFHVEMARGYTEPLLIWTAPIEGSGGRKTTTMDKMAAPFYAQERRWAQEAAEIKKKNAPKIRQLERQAKRLHAEANSMEDVEKAEAKTTEAMELESAAERLSQETRLPRLVIQDATVERVAMLLAENPRLCLLSDEGGPFDTFAGRYTREGAGPNLDVWLQAHACAHVRVDRVGRDPIILDKPRLAVAVMPQPSLVAKLQAREGFRGRGLLARFVWLCPRSRIGFRGFDQPPIDEFAAADYALAIHGLVGLAGSETTAALKPSEEALAVWQEFVRANEQRQRPGGDLAHMTDWASKASGLVARIAGTLHAVHHVGLGLALAALPIDADIMRRAVALVQAFTAHAIAAFGLMHGDAGIEAAHAIRRVLRGRTGQVRRHEVHQTLKGSYPRASMLDEGWTVLIERGYVREVQSQRQPGQPGRPSPMVEMRPEGV